MLCDGKVYVYTDPDLYNVYLLYQSSHSFISHCVATDDLTESGQ